MDIVRQPRRRNYTVLPNEALSDARLSFRARGVLAYLLSRPDGWKTSAERLAEQGKEGRDAIRTALAELERAGYLIRERLQGPGGKWSTHAVIVDEPAMLHVAPTTDFQPSVSQPSVSQASVVSTEPSTEINPSGTSVPGDPAGSEQAPTATMRTVIAAFAREWRIQSGVTPSTSLKGKFAGWAKNVRDTQWLLQCMPAIVGQFAEDDWDEDYATFDAIEDKGWVGLTDHMGRTEPLFAA